MTTSGPDRPDHRPAFDRVGQDFVDYYDTVRGYVRQEVTRANLSGYIQGGTLHTLDVGGGDGRDAEWLAGSGNTVHLIDPSEEMVNRASERIQAAAQSTLVTIDRGDPVRLLQDATATYDAVLSHGVMMYMDDPAAHLRMLHDVVKPGGIVSILTKGKDGSMMRLFAEDRPDDALELNRTDRVSRNNLGENVLAVDKKSMQKMLSGAGLRLLGWYGVRIVTDADARNIAGVPKKQLSQIVKLETALSRKKSVKGMGQMLHFICEREEN
jgi:S-adenosylmethionine-dependent methyltransferase